MPTVLFGFLFAAPVQAQQYTPEVLRDRGVTSKPAAVKPSYQTAETFIAPMPDADARAPYAPVRSLGVAPVFSHPASVYRGETFTADSTFDSSQRDQRFPISGIALKVPLN